MLTFTQLDDGWNAEPNAPEPRVAVDGTEVSVTFYVNAFRFPDFIEGTRAVLRFNGCERYRLGPTNDEGWYMGQCRFSGVAPAWGHFYNVAGDSGILLAPDDWSFIQGSSKASERKHYLFYFRDETFECIAIGWEVQLPANPTFQRTATRPLN